MNFKKLVWTHSDSVLKLDLITYIGSYVRYRIGPRENCVSKQSETWLFGNSICKKFDSVEQAKEYAQKDYENWIMKEFFEE